MEVQLPAGRNRCQSETVSSAAQNIVVSCTQIVDVSDGDCHRTGTRNVNIGLGVQDSQYCALHVPRNASRGNERLPAYVAVIIYLLFWKCPCHVPLWVTIATVRSMEWLSYNFAERSYHWQCVNCKKLYVMATLAQKPVKPLNRNINLGKYSLHVPQWKLARLGYLVNYRYYIIENSTHCEKV